MLCRYNLHALLLASFSQNHSYILFDLSIDLHLVQTPHDIDTSNRYALNDFVFHGEDLFVLLVVSPANHFYLIEGVFCLFYSEL